MMYELYGIVENWADVEDVLGETFVRLWRDRMTLWDFHEGALVNWIRTTAVNEANHVKRGSRRRGLMLERVAKENPGVGMAQALPDPQVSAHAADLRQLLLESIPKLPPEQAEAMTLRAIESMSIHDIAERMKTTKKAVEHYLEDARDFLRPLLEGKRPG